MKQIELNEEEIFMLKIAINYLQGKGIRDLIHFESLENTNETIENWIKETKKEFKILQNIKNKLEK